LPVEVVVRGETLDRVALSWLQDDVAFSRASGSIALDAWSPGIVRLTPDPVAGWYGKAHSQMVAGLQVERSWLSLIAPVFVPLLSSLLIPMLAIWLQQVEDGEFTVDAFELANILIGGLFAVIALNFTLNDAYPALAATDNAVSRLFGLNYFALASTLVINISLYRYGLVARWFGRYVQEQLFLVLVWAVPTLVFSTGLAFLLVAMA
jgi:hypothetical protein